jgi:molybdopterin/thiamine biosynthesis adenylyltransferase
VTEPAIPWFERWPDLFEWELARFEARGLAAMIDEQQRQRDRIVVRTTMNFHGGPLNVAVVYPSEYPELPPHVYGPAGLLDRHQHAFGGNFCLLERPLDDWRARDWGAADLIAEQLTRLLRDSEAGPAVVKAAEAPVPEPITAFYRYARDTAVLVPAELSTPTGDAGMLRVRRSTANIFIVEAGDGAKANPSLLGLFPPGPILKVPWRRIDDAPTDGAGDGPSLARWIRQHLTGMLLPPLPPKLKAAKRLSVPQQEMVALLVPEEGPRVGETRDAWVFVLVDHSEGTLREFLIHPQVVSREERTRRTPELTGLADCHAVVLGGGSLGGDVAIEFAKAGVGKLDVVDCDRFEFGNTVRHRLDLQYCGLPKSQAVALACRRANPFTEANGIDLRFGADDWLEGEMPLERLHELAAAADIVIDATGSHQIAQFASRVCSETDTPLVAGWLTEGSYGAEAVRIVPGRTRCWTCFAEDHRAGVLLIAEAGPPSNVVPQGCGFPTTTGAGFDAVEAAIQITRLAVQTLVPDGGYPNAEHDHVAISFRRSTDDPTYPRFATEQLPPTPDCAQCHAPAGAIAEP